MYPHHHLWQQHFPGFLLQDDKVLGRLIDAAILFTLPAQRQVFYPGKACQLKFIVTGKQIGRAHV